MEDVVAITILLTAATVSDLWDYKIRNQIILAGWLAGLAYRYGQGGIHGVGSGMFSILVVIILLSPLYFLHAVGAGDIKLLSVIGCFYGLEFLSRTAVSFLVSAGIVSFVSLVKNRMFLYRFHRLLYFILYERHGKYYDEKRDGRDGVIPLTPILSIAFFITYFLEMG